MEAILSSTLVLPSQATTCAFSVDGLRLGVGSDDGSVRLYQPPEQKVQKAIRGLGTSVSNVLFHTEDGKEIWVAAGKNVYRFDLTPPKMILALSDANFTKEIGQDDEDVVNQLALSANRAYFACTTDAGSVYVLDLGSDEVSKMKTSHDSIAWTASFIPDRPSELVTGGYDCVLFLHDFKLRTLLSRLEITPTPSLAPGISSLPPFITALALSAQGVAAIGTADGRIWVGLGGMKSLFTTTGSGSGSGKKGKRNKSKKWGGLNEEDGFFVKLGESLVAGLLFVAPDTLLSCTVHGKLELHQLTRNTPPSSTSTSTSRRQPQDITPVGGLRSFWSGQSSLTKVDALSLSVPMKSGAGGQKEGDRDAIIAVAGLHTDKKRGAVELWNVRISESAVGVSRESEGDACGGTSVYENEGDDNTEQEKELKQ
ncbi:WD40 repeat-like protein [Fomitiporia mediterranea MF3/22]|uniref:WD40 repeat-like protein n=1 Tax=Fomitiporia mediterranea (strain MF3/22) TaxID=694068 RepID=UPI0004409AA6|nr:WD40 repeat-like protein [Fomitiporia mediterranea MF3/22]EJD02384.1 WD40 repeat-like protein [Fomitiporia mediterranea MF3/22]